MARVGFSKLGSSSCGIGETYLRRYPSIDLTRPPSDKRYWALAANW